MWPGASQPSAVNVAAGMIIAALIIAALYFGRDLLIPLAIAGLLSFVLSPLLRRLLKWGIPYGVAVALVVAVLLGALAGGVMFAGRQVAQLMGELPQHEQNLRDKAHFLHSEMVGSGIWQRAAATLRAIEQEVSNPDAGAEPVKIQVAQNSDSTLTALFEYTRSSLPSLTTAGLALLLTVFMLFQYRDLRDRVVRLLGSDEIGRSSQALNEAAENLGHYLLLQSMLNASFGAFVGVALWAIGVPSAPLWGAFTAFMRFVPYIGSFLAAGFPIALAAMVDPGWWMVIETAAVFLIGEPLMGQVVEPLVFGTKTRLSPIAVVLGMVFWTLLWGPIGLVLAVPLTLAIAVLSEHTARLEFLHVLLGNEPALEPPQRLYRQLLAGDAVDAAKDANRWMTEQSFRNYLDLVVIPFLQMANEDQHRGALTYEQLDALTHSIAEYRQLLKEDLEYRREQEAASGERPFAAAEPASALLISGRGKLDHAAAELIKDVLSIKFGIPIVLPSPGGLTGVSASAASAAELPDVVAIVSAGSVTPGQLRLLLLRTRRLLPGAEIIVGYWGNTGEAPHLKDADAAETVRYAESASALIDLVARSTTRQAVPPAALPRRELAGGISA